MSVLAELALVKGIYEAIRQLFVVTAFQRPLCIVTFLCFCVNCILRSTNAKNEVISPPLGLPQSAIVYAKYGLQSTVAVRAFQVRRWPMAAVNLEANVPSQRAGVFSSRKRRPAAASKPEPNLARLTLHFRCRWLWPMAAPRSPTVVL